METKELSTPLVSVIVTAYNMSKYITNTIHSIKAQTYKNIELVVVEDCSTDNTLEIIKQFDDIHIVQNEKNVGAGMSRRIGIDASKGDFIILIDGDDWITSNFIEALVENQKETGAEIVSGGITIIKNAIVGETESYNYGKFVCEGDDKVFKHFGERIIFMNNKLIARRLCNAVPYCHRRYIEDTPTIVPMLYLANKVSYVNNAGYCYLMNNDSLTHTSNKFKDALYRVLCWNDLINFFAINKNNEFVNKVAIPNRNREIINLKCSNPTSELINQYRDAWNEFASLFLDITLSCKSIDNLSSLIQISDDERIKIAYDSLVVELLNKLQGEETRPINKC